MKSYTLHAFDGLSPATIIRLIQETYPTWHGFWLHNHGQDVIGILPKMRWILDKNTDIADSTAPFITKSHQRVENLQRVDSRYTDSQTPSSFDEFKQTLIAYHKTHAHQAPTATDRYHHGLMGYISYDISAYALNRTIGLQDRPLAYFGHYDRYLCHDGTHWQLCVMTDGDGQIDRLIDSLLANLQSLATTPLATPTAITTTACISKQAYRNSFDTAIDYLNAGDAYQINLTQCWQGVSSTPISHHIGNLFHATAAPFAGYVAIGNFEILSISPELFFRFHQQDDAIMLTTKPIKGTRPRSPNTQEDNRLKDELAASTKDLAENVMIVDLLRNDLGKYAKFGAVRVPVRFAIESFSNVHHMVSTVVATLGNTACDTPILQVLFDSLPAGSITGSPKKRACELIAELELKPRGAYCGTMGYLNFNHTGQWNVLIRTLQAHKTADTHHVQLWAGGGVTVLSDGDDEYQECLDKIGQIKARLAQPVCD